MLYRDSYWLLSMTMNYVLFFPFFLFYPLLFALHFCQKLRLSAVSLKNKMNEWMNEWLTNKTLGPYYCYCFETLMYLQSFTHCTLMTMTILSHAPSWDVDIQSVCFALLLHSVSSYLDGFIVLRFENECEKCVCTQPQFVVMLFYGSRKRPAAAQPRRLTFSTRRNDAV